MIKRFILSILLIIITISAAGCSFNNKKPAETRIVTNLDGTQLKVPMLSTKVAAVYGPAYEAMVVLGAESKIVVCADVQFQNFPWAKKIFKNITKLPYLKNVHSSVNTEELITYHPDLAFTFYRPNELKQLGSAQLPAVPGITTSKLADTKNELMLYAKAIGGKTELKNAEKYSAYFDEKLAMVKSITDKIPNDQRPTVYYAGTDILTTYGKYSDIPELISTAGGNAVSADLNAGNRTQINFEQLIKWNPDYIFIDHGGMNGSYSIEEIKKNVYADSRYKAITAVNKNQVYLSPSGVFYWDMGLQKILLLMQMAKILHPDAFKTLDMMTEIKIFYSEFFHYKLSDAEADKILQHENP